MFEVGRICIKLAGRDAGLRCVVIDVMDANYVMIDGETRRRKCNVAHLEPLDQTLAIKKGASESDVASAFKKIGVDVKATKPKKAAERPLPVRKGADQAKKEAPKAAAKKSPKKEKAAEKKADTEEKSEAKPKKAAAKKKAEKKEE